MPTEAKSVANYFITKAMESGKPVTPMKLQKLLYFAQGWHLAVQDEPLFNEQIEAWEWGPVVRTVYKAFKTFGSHEIDRKARELRVINRKLQWTVPEINPTGITSEVMDGVWDTYKNFSAAQMMSLTHEADTPWHRVFTKYKGKIPLGTDIPMEDIKRHFQTLLQ